MTRANRRPRQPRRVAFAVSFLLPPGARVCDARDYLEEAVRVKCQCRMSIADPMFMLDGDTVQVRRLDAAKRREALP